MVVLNQLHHLGGQQPALAHLDPFSDIATGGFDGAFKVARRLEVAVGLNQPNHVALASAQEAVDPPHHSSLRSADAVQLAVKFRVVRAVQQKVKQSRTDDLAALGQQKLLQIVVAQRRVFDIDFSDDADLDFLLFPALHLDKARDDFFHQCGDFLPAQQLFAEQLLCHLHAVVHRLLAFSRCLFIRDTLVVQRHNQIAAQHAVDCLKQHCDRQREAAGLFAF